jgi:hypothetical protein
VLMLNRNKTHCNLLNDLDEYVDYCSSKDFIRNMEQMQLYEMNLKKVFEVIMMYLSVGRIYN